MFSVRDGGSLKCVLDRLNYRYLSEVTREATCRERCVTSECDE